MVKWRKVGKRKREQKNTKLQKRTIRTNRSTKLDAWSVSRSKLNA